MSPRREGARPTLLTLVTVGLCCTLGAPGASRSAPLQGAAPPAARKLPAEALLLCDPGSEPALRARGEPASPPAAELVLAEGLSRTRPTTDEAGRPGTGTTFSPVTGLERSTEAIEHREGGEAPATHVPPTSQPTHVPPPGSQPTHVPPTKQPTGGVRGSIPPQGAGTNLASELPDLRVQMELPGGDVVYPLQVRVWNAGRRTAPPSQLTITWGNWETAFQRYTPMREDRRVLVPALQPNVQYTVPGLGGAIDHCAAPIVPLATHCRVTVTVDSAGQVMETDESNNEVFQKVMETPPGG